MRYRDIDRRTDPQWNQKDPVVDHGWVKKAGRSGWAKKGNWKGQFEWADGRATGIWEC